MPEAYLNVPSRPHCLSALGVYPASTTIPHCSGPLDRNRVWQVSQHSRSSLSPLSRNSKHRQRNPCSLPHPCSPYQEPLARHSAIQTLTRVYTSLPLPMPPHTNCPPSFPVHPILSFNLAEPQPPHLHPQHSANTDIAV